MSHELLIQCPDGQMKNVPLSGGRLAIGRSSAAELCFPEDAGLSRQHFAFDHATLVVQLHGEVFRVDARGLAARPARRRLGVPRDPLMAARQIGEELRKGSVRQCSVMRCTHGTPGGGTAIRHAVTMCGLGQWGRVPGSLSRWRERHNVARRRAAALVGLERVNLLEYVGFGTARLLAGTVSATQCELVELDGSRQVRLLAAVALNLPLPPLPHPDVTMSEDAAGLIVVPRLGRPFRRRLEPGAEFAVRLLDRESVEFFLDEDAERATGWLRLGMAGCMGFVPGGAE